MPLPRPPRAGRSFACLLLACLLAAAARDATRIDGGEASQPSFPSSLLPSLLPAHAFFLVRTNSSNIEAPSPFFVFGVTSFTRSGELVRARPLDGCEKMDKSLNATGRVVWIEPYHCSIETKIRNCAAAGCVAAVSSSSFRIPGMEMWTQWDGSSSLAELAEKDKRLTSKLPVPFMHVGRDDAELIRIALTEREADLLRLASSADKGALTSTKGIGSTTIGTSVDGTTSTISSSPAKTVVPALPTLNITGLDPQEVVNFHVYLSSSDSPNQWEEAFSSLYFTIFFQVMLGCLHIVVLLAAVAKFRKYLALRATRPLYAKIPLVCLAFLILSNFERGLYCFIDPMGALHVVPRGYRRVMMSISVPWTYASTLLLTFFWSEAISKRSSTALSPTNQQQAARQRAKSVDAASGVGGGDAVLARRKDSLEMIAIPSGVGAAKAKKFPLPKKVKAGAPRVDRSALLSIGRAEQYEGEDVLDEYVPRGQVHDEMVLLGLSEGEDAAEYVQERKEAYDAAQHADVRSAPVLMKSASPPLRITVPVPPPPASPPAIPAPAANMAQAFLVKPNIAASSSSASTACPTPLHITHALATSSRFPGLQSAPLYVHLHTHLHAKTPELPSPRSHQVLIHADASSASSAFHFMPAVGKKTVAASSNSSHAAHAASDESSHQFLVKYRFAFIISAVFLGVLDLTFSILDSMYILDWQLLPVVEIVFAIIGVLISIMYFSVSWRVIRRFRAETAGKLRSAEYNASQGEIDAAMTSSTPAVAHSPAVHAMLTRAVEPGSPLQAYVPLGTAKTPASGPHTPYAFPSTAAALRRPSSAPSQASRHLIGDIQRAHHERMIRMTQFLVGSGLGLLLFLSVTLASPQLWHSQLQSMLDDPLTTISRDFLLFLALFIIGACQVCAF